MTPAGGAESGFEDRSRVSARVAPAGAHAFQVSWAGASTVRRRVRLLGPVSSGPHSCPLAYAREAPHGRAARNIASKRWDQAIRLRGGSVLVFHLVRAAAKRPGPVAQWKSVPFTPGRSLVRSQPGPPRSTVTKGTPAGVPFFVP